MQGLKGFAAIAVLLAGCSAKGEKEEGSPAPAAVASETPASRFAAQPDLSKCPDGQPLDSELLQRTGPLPVPPPFAGLMKSSPGHFAVAAEAGNTLCVDTSWMAQTEDAKLSDDARFLAFGWLGYEEFGYVVIDRSGTGQVIDTGNPPFSAPSGMRFAAIDLSESGFGALNAFAVWDILPSGLRLAGRYSDEIPPGDWRIDRWQGEDCVNLSLLPLDRQPSDHADFEKTPRDPWHAAKAAKWKPAAGACPRT